MPSNTLPSFTIRGATVIDGSESTPVRADVSVIEGKIAEIGKIIKGNEVGEIIDASGLTLSPGFIDMHSHSDLRVISDPENIAKVSQGVTTEIVGQDGLSYVPCDEVTLAELRKQLFGWNGDPSEIDWSMRDVAGYLKQIDNGSSVNVGYLLPHGSIRMLACGFSQEPATADQMRHQLDLVETGMKQGALGMSAGLTYVPAMYASDDEITELNKVVAKYDGFYSPHHRNYGANFLDAVADCISIASKSGCKLHLTHCHMSHPKFHDKTDQLFELIDKASTNKVRITLDSYPYLAGSTYLHALLPSWSAAQGMDGIIKMINDPSSRARIIENLNVTGSDGNHGGTVNWPSIVIASVEKNSNFKFIGRKLIECAEEVGKTPVDFYLDLIADEIGRVLCILHSGYEPNVRKIMQRDNHMVGTDGILAGKKPHPRAYGTFTRYLGVYAREEKVISLSGAVARMTGRPAKLLRLKDRGLVKVGYRADLVLFDDLSVIDVATYENPHQLSKGIERVLINGQTTWKSGKRTDLLPGQAIRANA